MKNIIAVFAVALLTVTAAFGQSVIVDRQPQTSTVRPELVFQSLKNGGAATDTVTSDVIALKGTLYSAVATAAADTLHKFVGYQLVTGDTCTFSLAVQEVSPEGAPFRPGTWTALQTSIQYVPNQARELWSTVGISTHYVRFRLIRAQGATASVSNSLYKLFLYRY